MTEIDEAPRLLFDVDGYPLALRRDLAASPAKAIRVTVREVGEWLTEDLPGGRAYLRAMVEDTKPAHMRKWREGDEPDSEWGEECWYFCPSDDPDAVEYWRLPWN